MENITISRGSNSSPVIDSVLGHRLLPWATAGRERVRLPLLQVDVREELLVGHGSYTPPKLGGSLKGAAVKTSPAYSFAAQVMEIEVDEETGEIALKGVWDVHGSGT